MHGLLILGASLGGAHGLQSVWASVAAVHRSTCPMAQETLLEQGGTSGPWVGRQTLNHWTISEVPRIVLIFNKCVLITDGCMLNTVQKIIFKNLNIHNCIPGKNPWPFPHLVCPFYIHICIHIHTCIYLYILYVINNIIWTFWVVLVVKNLPANAEDIRDVGLIPGLGRSPGGEHENPLQYSCLENPMDRGAWWAMVHRVSQSDMTEAA